MSLVARSGGCRCARHARCPLSKDASGLDSGSDEAPVASLWTPRGRGAIATIRVRVDVRRWLPTTSLPFQAANGRPLGVQPLGRVVFGRWGSEPAEHVVLCALDEQTLEIHCHGGDAAAARILNDLVGAGCRVVAWQEMVTIAEGLVEAELSEALSRATTLRTAAILMEQSNGLLRGTGIARGGYGFEIAGSENQRTPPLGRLRRASDAALESRFGRPAERRQVEPHQRLAGLHAVHRVRPAGHHPRRGDRDDRGRWLASRIVGHSRPPGEFRAAGGGRDRAGAGALAEADLSIVLIDVSTPATDDDRKLLATFPQAIVVAHKCDLQPWDGPDAWEIRVAHGWPRVSSKTGEGVDALIRAISARLVPEVPPAGTAVPVTARQVSLLSRASEAEERGDLATCRQALGEILR